MNFLGPFRFTGLLDPWALVLLAGVVVLLVAEWRARAPGVLRMSTGETLARLQGHRDDAMRRAPPVLRAVGLALLVFALARPVKGIEARTDPANVIDIMLCVDVSGSMAAADFVSGGEHRSRLYVVKRAVDHFLASRKRQAAERGGRDRVGLVLFGRYAWTQCPLTLDYDVVAHELDTYQLDQHDRRAQGTAIGSALGLALSKLRKSKAKTKIIILLTDGLNNMGELDPMTAADIAKDYKVRVYTIGAGSKGTVLVPSGFGNTYIQARLPIDVDLLNRIANLTGGKFFRATNTESLDEAYNEIDRLERTKIKVKDYYDYEEEFMPYALLGSLALLASIFSRRFWFDPIP